MTNLRYYTQGTNWCVRIDDVAPSQAPNDDGGDDDMAMAVSTDLFVG